MQLMMLMQMGQRLNSGLPPPSLNPADVNFVWGGGVELEAEFRRD